MKVHSKIDLLQMQSLPKAEIAKRILEKDGITNKGDFYKFIEMDNVTGCDWIKFLIDKGFVFD